ncbi:ATP-binding cassette domain-containing protein [Providencia sp. Me31A]|uniref:ATP-binding cassette domain-containing protein n=1 Tax=Providencia sp. Me31A TaxID=3392637 RepID=UPI003D2E04A1
MLKTLLYTVRDAIFWMVLGAVLDGISGLLLFFVILNGPLPSSIAPLILLAICSLISLAITFVATQKGYFAGGLVMRYLAMALIRHLPLSLKPVPNANHLIAGPASQIMSVPAHLLHPVISGLVTPVTLIIGAFIYNSIFGAILLLIIGTLLFTLRFCASKTAFFEQAAHQSEQQAINTIDQFALHQPLIRRSNMSHEQQQGLKYALASQYQSQQQLQYKSLPFHLLFSIMVQTAFISLFGLGIYLVSHTQITLSLCLASMVLLARMIEPLWMLSHLDQTIRQSKKSLQQVENALETPELIFPYRTSAPINHSVSCEQLSFYNDEKKAVLQDINISFQDQKLTAIVGPSGAGKSTLLGLLARLQDPTQGQVSYGQKNVMELSQQVLCKVRGFLPQDSRLFRGTVRENLTPTKENIDERALSTLLTQLNFVADSTLLDKDVGAGGMLLSGGQRQRLCIARLLLCCPNIILMDEPTASLDNNNTASIIKLLKLAKQQTRIVVTHQPSLARQADQIVYMEQGKIIAQGTHQELFDSVPWYERFIQQGDSKTSQE